MQHVVDEVEGHQLADLALGQSVLGEECRQQL